MLKHITLVTALALGHCVVAAFHPGPISLATHQSLTTCLQMSDTNEISLGEKIAICHLIVKRTI